MDWSWVLVTWLVFGLFAEGNPFGQESAECILPLDILFFKGASMDLRDEAAEAIKTISSTVDRFHAGSTFSLVTLLGGNTYGGTSCLFPEKMNSPRLTDLAEAFFSVSPMAQPISASKAISGALNSDTAWNRNAKATPLMLFLTDHPPDVAELSQESSACLGAADIDEIRALVQHQGILISALIGSEDEEVASDWEVFENYMGQPDSLVGMMNPRKNWGEQVVTLLESVREIVCGGSDSFRRLDIMPDLPLFKEMPRKVSGRAVPTESPDSNCHCPPDNPHCCADNPKVLFMLYKKPPVLNIHLKGEGLTD